MKARLFRFAVFASAAIAIAIGWLWLSAGAGLTDSDGLLPLVSFSKNCHLTIYGHGADYRLAFYNDANYGPYHGSVIGMAGPKGQTRIEAHAFGDAAGIYYRYFRWPGGAALWTVMISLAWPLGFSLVLPLLWLCAHFRHSRQAN